MQDNPQTLEETNPDTKPMYLGMFAGRATTTTLTMGESIGLAIAGVWLLGFGIYFIAAIFGSPGTTSTDIGTAVMTTLLPAAIIVQITLAARLIRSLSDQNERLQLTLSAIRQGLVQQKQSGVIDQASSVERKLDEIAAAQRSTETKLARFTSIRPEIERKEAETRAALVELPSSQDPRASEEQSSLALGTPIAEIGPPLSVSDFIKALNFPDDPDDKEGFRALRRALGDHNAAQLVTAAQDLLTLLSQDGIYMDDLKPDRARPEIWRRFARGERGKSIAILGGIRDRSSLALSAGRMRQDTIFRDSVHHFLRKFDHAFTAFEKTASDLDIIALTDTRSARAFMLLGRVTGTFD